MLCSCYHFYFNNCKVVCSQDIFIRLFSEYQVRRAAARAWLGDLENAELDLKSAQKSAEVLIAQLQECENQQAFLADIEADLMRIHAVQSQAAAGVH